MPANSKGIGSCKGCAHESLTGFVTPCVNCGQDGNEWYHLYTPAIATLPREEWTRVMIEDWCIETRYYYTLEFNKYAEEQYTFTIAHHPASSSTIEEAARLAVEDVCKEWGKPLPWAVALPVPTDTEWECLTALIDMLGEDFVEYYIGGMDYSAPLTVYKGADSESYGNCGDKLTLQMLQDACRYVGIIKDDA